MRSDSVPDQQARGLCFAGDYVNAGLMPSEMKRLRQLKEEKS